jgi:hypothetical protein
MGLSFLIVIEQQIINSLRHQFRQELLEAVYNYKFHSSIVHLKIEVASFLFE